MTRLTSSILLLAAVVVLGASLWHLERDNRRLKENVATLSEGVTYYRTRLGASAASVARMQMTIRELREQRERDIDEIRSLGLRLRRVQSYATAATLTTLHLNIPISADSVQHLDNEHDSITQEAQHSFDYSTAWMRVWGIIRRDTLMLDYRSVDTLHQVIHRVPRKFLFFRFGTKGIRQEVWSSNPHTRLVYSEYIELK